MKDLKPTRSEIHWMRRQSDIQLAERLADERKDRAETIATRFMIENAEALGQIKCYNDQLRLIADLQARILAEMDL